MKKKSNKGGDATGWQRGERGYARCDTDWEHLTPDFNRRRQQGKELAVGMYATSSRANNVNWKKP